MRRLEFAHGAVILGRSTRFRVWAPGHSQVTLIAGSDRRLEVAMRRCESGYWEALLENAPAGTRYHYRIDDRLERPDPASRFQPEGVHGPSEVVDAAFEWGDESWRGLPLDQCVFYELHAGTFTPEGTFDAIIPHLPYLRGLGVTVVELMPVAQFPGARNWGYDGVCPFAVQNSYGGPQGLKRLVNACHSNGLGVALDVVYNHLGPEGNYLADYGPYFKETYKTPWGSAINFDGADSDEVRRYFLENAIYWVREFHIDALRLDAVHGIVDRSAYTFLEELGDAVHEEARRLNRAVHMIPESELNDPRLIRSKERGGFGLDAQWADDFHHALRVLLTGDRRGYYEDYGELRHLAKAFTDGYVFTGERSRFRRRRHGAPTHDIDPHRFVVFSQNHDHVGNRMLGERLGAHVCLEGLKLAATAVILSPHLPLLFMGEEFAETAPFLYFVSHSDANLAEAVRQGRSQEFEGFGWQGDTPDPQAGDTFVRSKLNHDLRRDGEHKLLVDYYRNLLHLRRDVAALAHLRKEDMSVSVDEDARVLVVRRWHNKDEVVLVLCFSEAEVTAGAPMPAGHWVKILDSTDRAWGGSGSEAVEAMQLPGSIELRLKPRSALLYRRCSEA